MSFTYNASYENRDINELHRRIKDAILEGKRAAISVTYNVAESEEDGIDTPTTEHVGQVIATTLQESTPRKRLLIFLAGMANPLEISNETETRLSIER